MITETQKTEIRNYLAAKNLPIDVILEVKDHFETQIEDLQFSKDLSFEEAFFQTKLLWSHDFTLVRKSLMSFSKVPRIVRNIQMTELLDFLKKAFILSVIFTVVSFVFAHFVTLKNFNYYLLFNNSMVSIPILFLLIFYLFSSRKKILVRAEVYYYNQLRTLFLASTAIFLIKNLVNIPDISVYTIYTNPFITGNYFIIGYNIFEDIATNTIGIYFLLFLVYRLKAMRETSKVNLAN